jgi:hypothetical protein
MMLIWYPAVESGRVWGAEIGLEGAEEALAGASTREGKTGLIPLILHRTDNHDAG